MSKWGARLRVTIDGIEKKCARCGEWLPMDEEFFNKKKGMRGGFHSWCRCCQTERIAEQRAEIKYFDYQRGLPKKSWYRIYPVKEVNHEKFQTPIHKD